MRSQPYGLDVPVVGRFRKCFRGILLGLVEVEIRKECQDGGRQPNARFARFLRNWLDDKALRIINVKSVR